MTRKRGNGEGSIFREKSGRYRISITVREDGKRTRRTRIAHKYADASAKLDELRSEKSYLDPKRVTVAQFLEGWLSDVIAGERAANTHDSYMNAINNHAAPAIGRRLLRSLSPLHVQQWLADMARDEVGSRTRQNAYTVVKAALDYAVGLRLIAANPMERLSKPKHETEEIFPFTLEESKKLMKHSEGHRCHAAVVLGLTAGMRQGEIFGLCWDCVDWKHSRLRVEQQALSISGKTSIAKPKTKASIRTVDVPPVALAALREHRAILLREGNSGSDLVFPAPKGGLTCRSNFRNRFWEPLLLRLAIERRGFHHCRHSYATLALGAGVPVTVVSKQLGHSRVSTTLDIYSHVLETHQDEAAKTIARLFG